MQTTGPICRDYLRNVCPRSSSECRFDHPQRVVSNAANSQSSQNSREPSQTRTQDDKVSVCRDFARGSCPRTHCRFLHLTPTEVRDYATNGNLPERILVARANGMKLQSADVEALNGAIPLCRDYLKGICTRRDTCRYLHLNNISEPLSPNNRSNSNNSLHSSVNARFEQDLDESPPQIKRMKATSSGIFEIQSPDEHLQPHHTQNETCHRRGGGRGSSKRHQPDVVYANGAMASGRRRSSVSGLSPAGDHYDPFSNSPPFPSPSGSTTSGGSSIGGHNRSLSNRRRIANNNKSSRPCSTCLGCNNLQEENRSLRLKVIELEKQVSNLSTTNDVLLTQNAKLRTNKAAPYQHQQSNQTQKQSHNPPAPIQQPTPVSVHQQGFSVVSGATNNQAGHSNMVNYGPQQVMEAPPPPPPVIMQNTLQSGFNNVEQGSFVQTQQHNQQPNILQQQHLQTAIQVPTGATVGAVHLTAHPRNPINATTVANVNATALPYFITQLTPNFTPINAVTAQTGALNASVVQSPGTAVAAAAPNGSIRAAILPHPANQVVAAGQPVAIAGSGQYTPTFLLPHVPTTTINAASANNPQQLTVTTLSLTPFAAAAGYTGQIYNIRPASATTYHLTPASAQTVCINALQAAPNMSPVVVAHTPSTLAAAAAAGQSMGSAGTAVFQTVQAVQQMSRMSSPHNS